MTMISDLPHDLESEILSKVPAKSLEKLKSTCKRWYTLFKDPRFIEKNNSGSEAAREDQCKLKNIKVSKIFQCDGLILCTTMGRKPRLVVWNPCNGYGNNSYKVLLLRCYEISLQKTYVSEFEIYDFSSDSWRVIDGLAVKFTLSSSLGVSMRENAYWLACHEETGLFLLSFDFTTERFRRLPLPFQSTNLQDTAASSVVREEKLSVLYRSFESSSSEAKIWVSNDEEAMTLDLDNFLLDEENEVAVCCDIDLDYGDRTRIHISTKGKFCRWPFLLSYVPSLVRIQKDTVRGKRKRRTRRLVE
ncbi:hypothetical protein EUTSA_v10022377mg [Eutrema salsugineum]|uniref:F-box domain-containing protein n=1 Tax=Eutrema salsugineum TaxID=72664 RepID=V4NNU6_EUTSA|nr:hypothetical protein EUTSA_v10022377mg [Eutrema salsugineum]